MSICIKIVTINTWKCEGDYFQRRRVLARQLQALDAQVIVCQECFRTGDGTTDTLRFLSEALGMEAHFVESRFKQRSFGTQHVPSYSGLGILSAFPVARQTILELPSSEEDGGRWAQLMTLQPKAGTTLLLANVHLTHIRHATQLRAAQLKCVLTNVLQSNASCKMVLGDFNDESGSSTLGLLSAFARAEDCYVLGGGAEPRTSLLEAFHRQTPLCVDHLFVLPLNGAGTYPACTMARMVLNSPDEGSGLYPSDHFGVCVTLIMD